MVESGRKPAIIGFDSVSLWFLDKFVKRGAMPTVKGLMARGSVTQTWPWWPWETGTNRACLAMLFAALRSVKEERVVRISGPFDTERATS